MLAGKDEFFAGALPKVLVTNAVTNVPNDLKFRHKFLQLIPADAVYANLRAFIYEGIARDFSAEVEAIKILATRPVAELSAEEQAMPVRTARFFFVVFFLLFPQLCKF
jgi:hypothetical protein